MSNLHRSWLALDLLAVVLLAAACGATQNEPLTQGDATQGRSLWSQSFCVGCHGVDAQGSTGGPALAHTPLTLREVINITRRGGPGMPEYPASQIDDQDLQHMYAWFQNPAPAPTREIVQDPWTQAPCAGCHGASALGGRGPSLAGISQSFAAFQTTVRRGARGMPAYSASQISDAELQRIYDWLRAQGQVQAAPQDQWAQVGCGACHGADAQGGSAPALAGEEFSYDEFQRVVRQGARGMPIFSPSQISDAELQRIYDWLRAQGQVQAAPQDQWVEAGCGACHGADAQGGSAPTLAGEEFSYDEFQRVVRQGARGMPAYSASQLSDAYLRRIYDWLGTAP